MILHELVNAMSIMKSIHFTCPQCGGHQLMLVEQALHRYVIQSLEISSEGRVTVAQKTLVDDLCGDPLGYRCADCRYPDAKNHESADNFSWLGLEDVQTSGAITTKSSKGLNKQKCMICLPDGTMTPVLACTMHSQALTLEERQRVLSLSQITQGVLICQSDKGIGSLTCSSWAKARQIFLHLHPSPRDKADSELPIK